MDRKNIINKTLGYIHQLPDEKLNELADYAEFLYQKYEENILQKGIYKLVEDSKSYDFLNEEEDLYTVNDITPRGHVVRARQKIAVSRKKSSLK